MSIDCSLPSGQKPNKPMELMDGNFKEKKSAQKLGSFPSF
jgi:hypothetical protein